MTCGGHKTPKILGGPSTKFISDSNQDYGIMNLFLLSNGLNISNTIIRDQQYPKILIFSKIEKIFDHSNCCCNPPPPIYKSVMKTPEKSFASKSLYIFALISSIDY